MPLLPEQSSWRHVAPEQTRQPHATRPEHRSGATPPYGFYQWETSEKGKAAFSTDVGPKPRKSVEAMAQRDSQMAPMAEHGNRGGRASP